VSKKGGSRYAGLGRALREKRGSDADGAPARRLAKSQDKANYKQTTAYIHTSVYNPLQTALAEAKTEYSQLVEDLLRGWLEGRGKSKDGGA
jgi:hypothetical protein